MIALFLFFVFFTGIYIAGDKQRINNDNNQCFLSVFTTAEAKA